MTKISMIAAIWLNNELGKDNDLLWSISEDMKRFKTLTNGHPVIMWRKTFESIPPKFCPLPNRTNIVISRNPKINYEWVIICPNIEEAIQKAQEIDQNEIFIIWWAQIYSQWINLTDRLYITVVESDFKADVFFPEYKNIFTKTIEEMSSQDENYKYKFLTLEK